MTISRRPLLVSLLALLAPLLAVAAEREPATAAPLLTIAVICNAAVPPLATVPTVHTPVEWL